MAATGHLARLLWPDECLRVLAALGTIFLLPLALTYISFRLAGDAVVLQRKYIAAGLTLAFGGSVLQVGSAVLEDRFRGRLELLRACGVPKSSYYATRVGFGVLKALLIVLVALIAAGLLGWVSLSVRTLSAIVVTTIATGTGLCAVAMVIAARARSADSGYSLLSFCTIGLALISPVYYSASEVPAALVPLLWLSPYTHVPPQIIAILQDESMPLAPVAAVVAIGLTLHGLSYRALSW